LLSIHSVCQAGFESREFNHPEQEKNYNELIDELRCLVCQNQTIADSNADLAKDLRRQVYEMLQQGKSRQDIVDYMLARYGDFVLYRPPLKSKTFLLWAGPVIFLLLGLLLLFIYIRNKKSESSVELNQQQHQKIRQLLEQDEDS
jgi:cytochrome c-type biogenesis protein CcmH